MSPHPATTPSALHFRDMTLNVGQLQHWLPGAAGDQPCQITADYARFGTETRGVTVTWEPLPLLNIGRLSLPRLRVCFAIQGLTAEEEQRFWQCFERAFSRGGG